MPRSSKKTVFISYRRRDSSQTARWFYETIIRNFGKESVFMDTGVIGPGDVWPDRIRQALKKASVVIVVIGPDWTKAHDENYRRLIDDPKDWVHKEIYYALQHASTIIPLRVLGAELPAPKALPAPLRQLLERHDFELRDEQRETDVKPLLDQLEKIGFERKASKIKYPPRGWKAPTLTDQELKKVLRHLAGWELDDSRVGPNGEKKLELVRTYEFLSFEDAIHFMSTAARHISDFDHHPDWENIWKTIRIWLTTWDIGHRPSSYDVELAEYFDRLYKHYETREVAPPKKSSKRAL